jgi:hypothetical protein
MMDAPMVSNALKQNAIIFWLMLVNTPMAGASIGKAYPNTCNVRIR